MRVGARKPAPKRQPLPAQARSPRHRSRSLPLVAYRLAAEPAAGPSTSTTTALPQRRPRTPTANSPLASGESDRVFSRPTPYVPPALGPARLLAPAAGWLRSRTRSTAGSQPRRTATATGAALPQRCATTARLPPHLSLEIPRGTAA